MLPKIIPRPIGISNNGSKSFLMARKMSTQPTSIINRLPAVALAKPVKVRNSLKFSIRKSVKPMRYSLELRVES